MIRFLVMDVDGTLTDGRIYMGDEGEVAKAFNIKDGAGILLLLPKLNIIPVIITARKSKLVENRCKELKISEIHQGVKDKLALLNQIVGAYGESLDSVAYVGDDLPDIPCMQAVKQAGGVVLCPQDAIAEIKAMADFVSARCAGDGSIRECIHYLTQSQQRNNTHIRQRVDKTIQQLTEESFEGKTAGVYQLADGTEYTIQEYETKNEKDCILESHKSHIDIQFVLSGCEVFKTYMTSALTTAGEYNRENDIEFWQDGLESSSMVLIPGSIIVVYARQPHKGGIRYLHNDYVRKVVCKVSISDGIDEI